jgi:hypothetical protein
MLVDQWDTDEVGLARRRVVDNMCTASAMCC